MGSFISTQDIKDEIIVPDQKEEERATLSYRRALGSVLGAFVGDAAGAYLEFWSRR